MATTHMNSSTAGTQQAERRWSYASGTSEIPLLGLTIGDLLDQTVDRYPDRLACIARHQGIRWTYREFQAQINQCAKGLIQLGLQKGQRAGIWSPNGIEWVVTQIAAAKIGVILVSINPAYRLHELEYALTQSGCTALLIGPTFKTSNYTQMINELAPELATCEAGALKAARLPQLTTIVRFGDDRWPGMYTWGDLLKLGNQVSDEQLAIRQREQDFDDPVSIMYTSGTTGAPKGATLSHHNMVNNGYFTARLQKFTHEDRVCIPVPLYHIFGTVIANLGCVTHGATMIYPSEVFEPLTVLQTVHEEKCTVLMGVPTMFIALLDHPDFAKYDLSTLRTGVMGGAPCPVEVMKKVKTLMHMKEITICFGMTETSPVSTQTRTDAPFEKQVGTVGQAHPHVEIKVIDPSTGRVVPIGEPGEVCTRGYSVMLGYWNNPIATMEAIDQARWMHTGDQGMMDAEGYLNIVGRIKDMIIRGGENIYPREIEELLYTYPGVSDVQVIGVPNAQYGEEVMAWVRLKPGVSLTEVGLKAFCQGKITHFKIPRYFKFVDAFPMTVTGKIQKFIMRKQAIEELGLQQAASIKTA
jgi:fatty-acyl-CoA synthase